MSQRPRNRGAFKNAIRAAPHCGALFAGGEEHEAEGIESGGGHGSHQAVGLAEIRSAQNQRYDFTAAAAAGGVCAGIPVDQGGGQAVFVDADPYAARGFAGKDGALPAARLGPRRVGA